MRTCTVGNVVKPHFSRSWKKVRRAERTKDVQLSLSLSLASVRRRD